MMQRFTSLPLSETAAKIWSLEKLNSASTATTQRWSVVETCSVASDTSGAGSNSRRPSR